MKLALGTVQFGLNYGISNSNGQVYIDEVDKILRFAHSVGISVLDTASTYGESEKILGTVKSDDFDIITKTTKWSNEKSVEDNLHDFDKAFSLSKQNLHRNNLYGLLFHESNDLLGSNGKSLWAWAEKLKETNEIKKLGVSVYYPEQVKKILDLYKVDIVQLPLNVLDQRFLSLLPLLKERHIEIYVRSVFLQGLLLMEPNKIDPYFNEILPLLKSLPTPRLEFLLNFVKNNEFVDKILVGVTSLKDLEQIHQAYLSSPDQYNYSDYAILDERFILPMNWSRK